MILYLTIKLTVFGNKIRDVNNIFPILSFEVIQSQTWKKENDNIKWLVCYEWNHRIKFHCSKRDYQTKLLILNSH